jgi:enoyl-CoA hydratase/carnithine racemase
MEYKAITWSIHDHPQNPGEPCIGVITLNRPDRMNAVDPLMRLELDALCNEIARNSIVKVVILTGAGRGFCAGGDLKSEGEVLGVFESSTGITGPYKELAEYFFNDLRHKVLQSAMKKLEDLPQVTIAAVNGPAVGVGLEMATLCDMRIASEKARFGEVAVPAGFVPESGGSRNLPKLVGIGRAMRLILTGEIIDAKEAERIGLVEDVVAHEELMNASFALAA